MNPERRRTLVITNDFPPRRGGIESFVYSLCEGLPADGLVVYTARMDGAETVDARVPYRVIRDRARVLLPTPRVAAAVARVAREHGCEQVVFGAAAPLGLLAGGLREAGVRRLVGLTHGHEVWWARTPGASALLRRIGDQVDVLTYVSVYCRDEIGRALSPAAARAMRRLSPGVDTERFRPGLDGAAFRARAGIGAGQRVVLAASRLVPRKGHDVLIEAWPRVVAAHPDTVLLVVGQGPSRGRLQRLVRSRGVAGSVRMVPSVAWEEMPKVYAAASVFALPCRTRLRGLEPEAFGIVFLEAAASGLPVIVGDSGGAPETVADGQTGYVVDPRDPAQVAQLIIGVLGNPAVARAMGERGRDRVRQELSLRRSRKQLYTALLPPPVG